MNVRHGWVVLFASGLVVGCPASEAQPSAAGLGEDSSTGATATASASDSSSGGSTGTTTVDSTTEDSTSTSTTDDSTTDGTTADSSSSGEGTSSGGGSSSSTGEPPADTHQLYQGVFNGSEYEYGFGNAIEILDITGAPDDTDWSRWAMLNDDGSFRLYFMQQGSDDTIYQFVYNPMSQDYEYGLGNAIDTLGITGAPADADGSSFAMLYSGTSYRLYMQSVSDPLRVHQFVYNPATENYEYGLGAAIEEIDVTMFPGGTDFAGWGMLWEGDVFRFYAFASGAHDAVAQGAYNAGSEDYEYGFMSIDEIDIVGFPADTNTDDFAMLHDGEEFRLYMLRQ